MADQSINPLYPVPRPPDALKKKKAPETRRQTRKPAPEEKDKEPGNRHIDTYA
jgi:hypothetical protein